MQITPMSKDELLASIYDRPKQAMLQFLEAKHSADENKDEDGLLRLYLDNLVYSKSYRRASTKTLFDNMSIKLVHGQGGDEGDGEYVERVFGFFVGEEPISYARCTGYYESYHGTTWDNNVHVVYPREVTETKYFTEKL
jgi:hypothetical protein